MPDTKVKIEKIMPEFEDYKFAARALSKDRKERRPHVLYLFIDANKRVCAADGRRLHTFITEYDLEPGFYEVVKNNKSCIYIIKTDDDSDYPKYEDALNSENYESIYNDAHDVTIHTSISKINHRLTEKYTVKYNYVVDATKTGVWDILVYKGTPDETSTHNVIFTSDRCTAVIMLMEMVET